MILNFTLHVQRRGGVSGSGGTKDKMLGIASTLHLPPKSEDFLAAQEAIPLICSQYSQEVTPRDSVNIVKKILVQLRYKNTYLAAELVDIFLYQE